MDCGEYALMHRTQEQHWWYQGRRRILERLLHDQIQPDASLDIADIGSGFGCNIPILLPYGRVWALEMHDEALDFVRSQWPDKVTCVRWKYPDELNQKFDLIVLADVIEHVGDDAGLVTWIYNHLKLGGLVVITVPAHQFLWTEMDEVVHHFRRYSRASLRKLFKAPFKVVRLTYYNMLLFPIKVGFVIFARCRRLLAPRKPKRSFNDVPPQIVNKIFTTVLAAEARVLRSVSLPMGVSLILLARRAA